MSIETSRGRFPCHEEGSGPPVLLIHGAASDQRVWAPVAAALPNSRVIAPTLRWFGPHDWRPDGPAFGERTHAADLAAIIEAIGLGPLPVAGWSYGANVALRLAVDRPDLVSRVLVYETGAPGLVTGAAARIVHRASMALTFGPTLSALRRSGPEAAVPALLDAVGGRGAWDALGPELRAASIESAGTMPMLVASKSRPASVAAAEVAALPMPLRAAWGTRSRRVWTMPSAAVAAVAAGGPVQDADHLWPLREPERFAALLRSWLTSVE